MKREFEFIDGLRRMPQLSSPDLITGIGDDAAVFTLDPKWEMVVTTDLMAEGIHFRLDYTSPQLLGRKALAVNLSDVAAMGAVPRFFLFSLASPKALGSDFLDGISEGMMELAREHNVILIGGDTCASREGLFLSITVLGSCLRGTAVGRNGARPGDLVCMTGVLGAAALGLRLLEAGKRLNATLTPEEWTAVSRHLDPQPRVTFGYRLAEQGIVSAMIDISDGLSSDLTHLCHESGVGCELWMDALPLASGATMQDGLNGGEDYELLFTLPPDRHLCLQRLQEEFPELPVTTIGIVTESTERFLIEGGVRAPLVAGGYDHFR